jgi:hypothetical protein
MDAYFTEIPAQARLHEPPCRRIKRLAGQSQDWLDDGRQDGRRIATGADPTQLNIVTGDITCLTRRTLPVADARSLGLHRAAGRHSLRNPIGLPLVRIPRSMGSQLCLERER